MLFGRSDKGRERSRPLFCGSEHGSVERDYRHIVIKIARLGRHVHLFGLNVSNCGDKKPAELTRCRVVWIGQQVLINLAQCGAQTVDERRMLAGHGNRLQQLHIDKDANLAESVGAKRD